MTRKKILKITKVTLMAAGSIFIIVSIILNWQIQHYKKVTLNEVRNNKALRENYGIFEKTKPEDYGFKNVKECSFYSKDDRIKLSGWFMPANKESKKCLIIAEGRGVNRMKAMKFLELIKVNNLDEEYNIYLGDMRNSGGSDSARTAMGYKFAEDIFYTIEYLNEEMGMRDISLFTFSMSSMGTAVMLNRNDLKNKLSMLDVKIEKIIMDSPVSNSKAITANQMRGMNIPSPFIWGALFMLNLDVDSYLDNMRLGKLLKDKNIDILIINSKEDKATPYVILKEEIKEFDKNIKIHIFDKGNHVSSYIVPENKQVYTDVAGKFLKGEQVKTE